MIGWFVNEFMSGICGFWFFMYFRYVEVVYMWIVVWVGYVFGFLFCVMVIV